MFCRSQVRSEGFVGVDDCVGGDVLLAVRLPQRAELGAHVPPLVVDVLVAGRHLLDRVDVDIDVRGGVRRVEHLTEGQNEAACGVLEKKNNKKKTRLLVNATAHSPPATGRAKAMTALSGMSNAENLDARS